MGASVAPAHATLQEAFDRLWQCAADPTAGVTAKIEYQTEDLEVPPPAELGALGREVAGAPAHPRRLDLWRYEQALAGHPSTRGIRLWLTPGAMRVAEDMDLIDLSGQEIRVIEKSWTDHGITDGIGWFMGAEQLTVVDHEHEHEPGYGTIVKQRMIQRDLGMFLCGGLQVARSLYEMEPGVPTGPPERVRVVSGRDVNGGRLDFTWTGRYDAEADVLLIHTMKVTRAEPAPGEFGSTWRFEGWTLDETLGLWRASIVTEYAPDGRPEERWTWVDTASVEPARVKALARVPDLAAPDPIRGEPTFEAIRNRTGRDDVYSRINAARTQTHEVTREPIQSRSTGRTSLRYIGWGSGITLIVLILWRAWRRGSTAG